MPEVVLSSSWLDNVGKVDPCFADQLRLLVIVEYRALQLVVVWRIVNIEPEFLVPFGRLTSSAISVGLLCVLCQPHGAIWVLLADCLPVRQILCSVDDGNEGSDGWTVQGHIRIDASSMANRGLLRLGENSHDRGSVAMMTIGEL